MQVMHFSNFVISLVCLSFCEITLGETCGEGWLQAESKCYRVLKANATFEAAKFICTNVYKAELLTETYDLQEDILVNIAKSIYGVSNGIWIAGSPISTTATTCYSIGRNGIDKVTQDCNDRSSFVCEKKVPKTAAGQSKGAEDKVMSEEVESLKSKMVKMEKELSSLKETVDKIMSTFQVPECKSDVNPEAKSLVDTNDVAGQNTSTSAPLSMKCAAPPVIVQNPGDGVSEVKEGQNLTLGCFAVGYPKPSIKWIFPNNIHGSVFGPLFTIGESKGYQTGHYVCVADNKVGEAVNATFNVKVIHAPKVRVENSVIHTGTGQTVQLKCMIEAYPSAQIVWLKQKTGESLQKIEFKELNETSHQSTLNVTISDTATDLGIYTCSASNKEGSSHANVSLVGSPPFDVQVKNVSEYNITKFNLTLMATSYSGIQEYKLKIKVSDNPFSMETSFRPTVWPVSGKKTYIEYFEMSTSYRKHYQVTLLAKNEFGWSQSSEFRFNSTYVCGDNITATDSWRYLVSHEFYGIYNVPNGYECVTQIGSDSGLQIEFLEMRRGNCCPYDLNVVLNSVGIPQQIQGRTKETIAGSSFTLRVKAETFYSNGFKARFKSANISSASRLPI